MPIRIGKGRSEVTIEGMEGVELEAKLRDLLGPVLVEMEGHADFLLDEARKTWPVRTGTSLASLDKVIRLQPPFEVEVHLTVVRYGRYIVSAREGEQRAARRPRSPIWTELRHPARDPANRARLATALKDSLARHLRERVFRG